MDMKEVYRQYKINPEFRDYVIRYSTSKGITVKETLQHSLVHYAAEYWMEEARKGKKQ